jgi:hypothetical protein
MRKVAVYRWARLALIVSSLLAGMALLAACGGQTPAATTTFGPTAVGTTAVGPKVVGQNCGHVSAGTTPFVSSNSVTAENCLWQAWTQCRTATLVLTQFSVDTGVTRWITVQPARGACVVTDTVQHYMVPARQNQPVTTYTCAGLARSPDGGLLVHSCGADGNLMLAPPTSTPKASVTPA